jgi:hypothetical protein
MKETPNHFLDNPNVKIKNNDIKTLEDFIYNVVSELARKTSEISFFIIEEDSISQYS